MPLSDRSRCCSLQGFEVRQARCKRYCAVYPQRVASQIKVLQGWKKTQAWGQSRHTVSPDAIPHEVQIR